MDIKKEPEEILESYNEIPNHLVDYNIVKEEYAVKEASEPAEEWSSEDQKEFVNFEIREIEPDIKEEKIHKCSTCDNTFPSIYKLKKHKLSHSSDRLFKCAHCPKTYKTRQNLRKHLEGHKDPVPCHICKKEIKSLWGMRQHLKRQHLNKAPAECPYCCKVLTTKANLKIHIQRVHESDGPIEKKPMVCLVCGKLFKRKHNFESHVAKAHQAKRFECNICFREFKKKKLLTSHMGTHNTEKPFVCEICNKAFRLELFLKCHIKIHNTVKKEPVDCNYCSKTFKTLFGLQSHMKYHHRGFPRIPGPFPSCTICKITCKDFDDLQKHVAIHPVVNRFECAICGMKTKFKYLIAKHIRKVHEKVSDQKTTKTVECPICYKRFFNSKNLKAHIATHNTERSFGCDVCTKSYKSKESLRFHQKSHMISTKNKNKKCSYCNKVFKVKLGLTYHMRTFHRGLPANPSGPPFRCTICKETHKTVDSLKKHVKMHWIYFNCAICNKKYLKKRLLEIHMERVHMKPRVKKEKRDAKEHQKPHQASETVLDVQDIKVELESI